MATNSHPTKVQLMLVTALLLAVLSVTFAAAPATAQTSCNGAELMTMAKEASDAGYYGVTLDLGVCQVQIIFKNPATSPVSPLPTPVAAPVAASAPVTVTHIVPKVAFDYVQDPYEVVPANNQNNWLAPVIVDVMKAAEFGLDPAQALYDFIDSTQLLAVDLGVWTLPGTGILPMHRDFRWLGWDSNYNPATDVLPEAVEEVYCLKYEDGAQSCIWLFSAVIGHRSYSGLDEVWAVR